jgi:hypothetical protein
MGRYRPGELIEAEIEFQHVQVVREVFLRYKHSEDDSALPVILRGEPWENGQSSGGGFSSEAQPTAVVEQDQKPGTYLLSEIIFETFAGQRIPLVLDDEFRGQLSLDTQAFLIMEEPDDAPKVRKLRVT